jgi:hypothetical protein
MKPSSDRSALFLPPALMAAVEAAAAEAHRSMDEIVREALEHYLAQSHHRETLVARRTPADAAARMRQRRDGSRLPDGVTIRDLMTDGRA